MGNFKDHKEKICVKKEKHLKMTTCGKYLERREKEIHICDRIKTSSIRYYRKKEKKYPIQMNGLVKLEFLLLTTQ